MLSWTVSWFTRFNHWVYADCVNCFPDWAAAVSSAAAIVHADFQHNIPCRVPRLMARDFNRFRFDSDVPAAMKQNSDGKWEREIMDG